MTAQRKRARRRTESYDGPYWVGGMVSRSWRDLLASPDAAERLRRMIAHARQKADAGSKVHASIAAELERELAQLTGAPNR